jgi:hypothetical protein
MDDLEYFLVGFLPALSAIGLGVYLVWPGRRQSKANQAVTEVARRLVLKAGLVLRTTRARHSTSEQKVLVPAGTLGIVELQKPAWSDQPELSLRVALNGSSVVMWLWQSEGDLVPDGLEPASELEVARFQFEELAAEREHTSELVRRLLNERDQVRSDLKGVSEDRVRLEDRVRELETELQDAHEERQEAEGERNGAREARDHFESEVDDLRSQLQDLEDRTEALGGLEALEALQAHWVRTWDCDTGNFLERARAFAQTWDRINQAFEYVVSPGTELDDEVLKRLAELKEARGRLEHLTQLVEEWNTNNPYDPRMSLEERVQNWHEAWCFVRDLKLPGKELFRFRVARLWHEHQVNQTELASLRQELQGTQKVMQDHRQEVLRLEAERDELAELVEGWNDGEVGPRLSYPDRVRELHVSWLKIRDLGIPRAQEYEPLQDRVVRLWIEHQGLQRLLGSNYTTAKGLAESMKDYLVTHQTQLAGQATELKTLRAKLSTLEDQRASQRRLAREALEKQEGVLERLQRVKESLAEPEAVSRDQATKPSRAFREAHADKLRCWDPDRGVYRPVRLAQSNDPEVLKFETKWDASTFVVRWSDE